MPPPCSIVYLFTFEDGTQEAAMTTYPTDAQVRDLWKLLLNQSNQSPVALPRARKSGPEPEPDPSGNVLPGQMP
jgi:hypothetical protein